MKNDIEIIRAEFLRSADARYIHRLHGVLLVLLGLSTVKAGKLLGDPQRTIAHWVAQFKARGLDGLKDAEKSGRPEILSSQQKEIISLALASPPRKAGFDADAWTNVILASLLKERFGLVLSVRHCSRLLRTLKQSAKP